MNVAYLLTPKSKVAYLYDDCTFRQGLEKMKHHGYTAIPVVTRENKYVGIISEGDFLWNLVGDELNPRRTDRKSLENLRIRDILHPDKNQPVRIGAGMEELLERSLEQNFIPVIDDLDSFIGIITRRSVISWYSQKMNMAKAVNN